MKPFKELFGNKEEPESKPTGNPPRVRSALGDKKVKETVLNIALTLLTPGEHYDQLAFTGAEFGYLFWEAGSEKLQGLFKITTDRGVFCFGAQNDKVMLLQFNEDMFQTVTAQVMENFPELKTEG